MEKKGKVLRGSKLFLLFVTILSLLALTVFVLPGCTPEDAVTGAAAAGFAGIWIVAVLVWLLMAAVGIFFFVIWIITLIDCAKRDNDEFPDATENSKLIWILVIVLAGGIGAIIYYFVVMRKMPRKK